MFDGDELPHRSAEIRMLDQMAELLTPEWRWGKHAMAQLVGEDGATWGCVRYCLYGALNMADHGDASWVARSGRSSAIPFRTVEAHNIDQMIIKQLAPRRYKLGWFCRRVGVRYNDRHRTTYADIMMLLKQLRQAFAAQLPA